MTPTYYTPNLNTPLVNKVICLFAGLLMVLLLAMLHGIVSALNPIIYLAVVITIGFGLLMGIFYRVISKIAKIRDQAFVFYSGVLIAVFGMFFSWGSYVLFLFEGGAYVATNYFASVGMLLQLNDLGLAFKTLYEEGGYEVFGFMVRGNALIAVWLMELGIVVSTAFKILRNYHVAPFSERYNKWYPKYTLLQEYQSMPNERWFLSQEGNSYVEKIDQLKPGRATRFGRISIFYLPHTSNAYLLYENVERDGNGKKEQSTPIIDKLLISGQEAKEIIERCHGKKNFFLDY